MNLYTSILLEFLLISSSILLLFKFRAKIGLAPLYILLGSIQYLQTHSGIVISVEIIKGISVYPGSAIVFSAGLFTVLLIYIKEGVSAARNLIFGIIISNILLSMFYAITHEQELALGISDNIDSTSVFLINHKQFISGTLILLIDFFLLVVLYQFLVSKIKKVHTFLILFTALFCILIFDAFAFNIALFYGTPIFKTSLIGHIIGKTISAIVFSIILYLYMKYFDNEATTSTFIANQDRDIFSIIKYRKRYKDLKVEKEQVEQKLTSQLETTLNNSSDGFISLDTNWCYTYVNEKAAELLRTTRGSLIGNHIWTEFPGDVDLPFYKACYKAVETQKTVYIVDYYEPFDKWFENRIYPSHEGLTIYFTDITEKKNADTNNQMLLSLIETSDDFIGLISLEGKPIYLNANGRDLIGLETDETLPVNISDFFPEKYRDIIVNEHVPNIHKDKKWKGEAKFVNFKTGGLIPIEMSGFLTKDKATNNPIALGVVATDITKRKKAEKLLNESKEYLDNIINNMGDPVFVKDDQSQFLLANNAFYNLFNRTKEELLGKNFAKDVPLDERERYLRIDKEVISKGMEYIDEDSFKVQGEIRFISTKKTRFIDENGKKFLIGTIRDITKSKEAEKLLIDSKNYLDNIINNIGDPVFVKDEQSRFIIVNDVFCEIFNLSKSDIIGKTLAENINPDELEIFLKIDKQVILTGIENVNEETLTVNGGETRIISTKKTRYVDSNNNKFLIGVIRDITEGKKAAIVLKENEEKFSKAFESNVIGKAILNKEKKIIEINKALANIVGFKRENMLGKTAEEIGLFNFDSQKNLENENKLWSQFNKKGYVSNIELQYLMQSGRELFILISLQALQLNNEDHILITVLDITEKKNIEAELEKHRNNLEELIEVRTSELEKEKVKAQSADLMKSAFLATMSHELRTPMNSIIGFTGILLKELAGPINDEQKKQLSMVKNSGEHLLGLINDVLDISKIEAGKLKVTFYPFDYLASLKRTIDFLVPQASAKGLIMSTDISVTDIVLISDERRVEQILLNLLSNAIKFSKKGTIIIKVNIEDNMLITQVVDQGIGISKKDLVKLFMPFIQLEGGLSRAHEGSGLGLAICKNLIEKLGGAITVESQLRKGSNFTFKLPLENSNNK